MFIEVSVLSIYVSMCFDVYMLLLKNIYLCDMSATMF